VIGGNGNGALDPGENATLRVTLRNFGREAGSGISATLSTLDPHVTINQSSADFPNIGVWSTGSSLAPDFEVTASTSAEGLIEMTLTISCDQEDDRVSTFPLYIGPIETVYQEGFEAGDGGWSDAGTNNDWRFAAAGQKFGKPDPYRAGEGLTCLGNDLNEVGAAWNTLYAIDGDSYVQSPNINCLGKEGVHLAFRRWLSVEEGIYDAAFLSVNETELFRNPMNAHIYDEAWEEVVYDISAIADNNPAVRIRFDLESDGGLQFGGWAIDDVRLFVPGPPAADVPDSDGAPLMLSMRPAANPFRPGGALQLAVPAPGGRSHVRIFDPSGRSVRVLDTGLLTPGIHEIRWDGADGAGHPLPAGVYFVRAMINQMEASNRFVMVR
jgi:hypothetical protein